MVEFVRDPRRLPYYLTPDQLSAVALRVGDFDPVRRRLHIRRSRHLGAEAATKTRGSARTIEIQPSLAALLRKQVAGADPARHLFLNLQAKPINQGEWPKDHWARCLADLKIRVRKFYATRHTFISLAVTNEAPLVELARYAGTSVQMIERNYARYMPANYGQFLVRVDPLDVGENATMGTTVAVQTDDMVDFVGKRWTSPTGFEPVLPT